MSGPVGVGGFEEGDFEGDSPTEKQISSETTYTQTGGRGEQWKTRWKTGEGGLNLAKHI